MPSSPSGSDTSHHNGDTAVKADDERTPLLAANITAPVGEAAEAEQPIQTTQEGEEAPLPRGQIFLLCYTSLVEPVAFFAIFPYINKMIEQAGGIRKDEVGFYSGLIESLFSATQMCVMVPWGRAADRFGRKPVLVFSLFGVTVTTALFGLSSTIWQMILFRCMSGVFSGTVVTVRAMLTENSSKSTQAKVFSWFAFARNMGIFIGPILGGTFESPADKFKSTFGRARFFHDYPYAFPGFISASVGLSSAILATVFLKETLHLHQSKKDDEAPVTTWELMNYPGVRQVILIYNYVLLLAFAFTAVFPVFQYTPINLGGLGLPPGWIAAAMGVGGGSQALWLLLVFPWWHKRVGSVGILRICAFVWPIFFAIDPLCNVLLRYNQKVIFWILFFLNNIVGSGVAMAFTVVQLAINDIAPSHETIGTLNALVLAVSCGLRAVIPALSTSIYAIGVKYHIIGGQLLWVILICVAVGLTLVIRLLPEKAAGRPQRGDNEQT
ncbi:MFS general substrate transporter [Byssothecium circinans]|uniref:MFS general substrate transporter n=1 Tax=Byssothecium circinans TaxID=147558 RepID=A0A6A5U994_9PLEO|nr:MFS general substrate transporter [Byssothecium circinans]